MTHVGIGYDVHQLVAGRKLILGGVEIPHPKGLDGHLVSLQQGKIINIDATVIAQAPKIYPHIAAMKKNLAEALGLREAQVGIKATTNELMGFIGRQEGIAAMAVASIHLPE